MLAFLNFGLFNLLAAGLFMVSLPIAIHLINRMRYRRIRWAAMEFLLKAQKRQRRRLIIEQLILLAMRCLLIALLGYWLGQFAGFARENKTTEGEQQVLHVVVIDDKPSMADRFKEGAVVQTNSFEEGKKMLRETIARRVLEEAEHDGYAAIMVVYRLSNMETPLYADRLNKDTLEDLKKAVADEKTSPDLRPVFVSQSAIKALEKAEQVFNGDTEHVKGVFDVPENKNLYQKENLLKGAFKAFHFISDFRESDWKGPNAVELHKKVDELIEKGVKIYAVDMADPTRSDAVGGKESLPFHDNLAVIDFRADTAVAAEFEPVRFTLTVKNFTNRKFENVKLTVKANGQERAEAPPVITLPTGVTNIEFKMGFSTDGFNHIEAVIEDPEELHDIGLKEDNRRLTVIKIEKKLRILVVDGDFPNPPRAAEAMKPKKAGGTAIKVPKNTGTFYLQTVLNVSDRDDEGERSSDDRDAGYQVIPGRPDDLETPLVFHFPCIFIMNIAKLSDTAVANLEKFVREGGGLCFFLGDKVLPLDYNNTLFKNGTGLFPAPLKDRPSVDPAMDNVEELIRRLNAQEPSMFIRDETHPMFAPVYKEDQEKKLNSFLPLVLINKYYGVDSTRYRKEGDGDKVEELITLPNRKGVEAYRGRLQKLLAQLPVDNEDFKEFAASLEDHRSVINRRLSKPDGFACLIDMSRVVYSLLNDPGNPDGKIKDKPKRPSLDKFWSDPRNEQLRRDFERFDDEIRYGDPFLVGRQFEKGRVLAFMSSSNGSWNNWMSARGAVTFVAFMPAICKYLITLDTSANHNCGDTLTIDVDPKQYDTPLEIYRLPEKQEHPADLSEDQSDYEKRSGWERVEGVKLRDSKAEDGPALKGKLVWHFTKAQKPGVYVYTTHPLATQDDQSPAPERKAVSYNLDAAREGDLRRATDDAFPWKGKGESTDSFFLMDRGSREVARVKQESPHYWDSPWLYLAFLVLLMAEQAMAVHCGHHSRAADLPASAEISMHTGRVQTSVA